MQAGRRPNRSRNAMRRSGVVVRSYGRRGSRAAAATRVLAGIGRWGRRAGRHAARLGPRRRRRGRRARRVGRLRRVRPTPGWRPRRRRVRRPPADGAYHRRGARRSSLPLLCLAAGQSPRFWIEFKNYIFI